MENAIRHSKVLASGTKNLPLGGVQGGTAPPNLNMGPPKISETTRGRMLKLKTQLDIVKYSLYVKKFSARWRPGGVGPPSVNLGPPNISESERARKLKLKTPYDIVKYSPRVQRKFR